MGLLNCWNWKNCGRYPDGPKSDELGVCPATTCNEADGYLGGRGAGRGCIYLTGTLCGGKLQGSYASKQASCLKCDYYIALKEEYGSELNSFQFKDYLKKPQGNKRLTPKIQKWKATNKTEVETAISAKKYYNKKGTG